jgi:hypothetical protein
LRWGDAAARTKSREIVQPDGRKLFAATAFGALAKSELLSPSLSGRGVGVRVGACNDIDRDPTLI